MISNKVVPAAGSGGAAIGVPPAERLLLDIIDTVREPLLVLDVHKEGALSSFTAGYGRGMAKVKAIRFLPAPPATPAMQQ